MKRFKITLAAFSMMFACSTNVSAQSDLGKLLGGLIERVSNDSTDRQKQDDKKGGLFEGLSNIFNIDKIASSEDLVGTWKFTSPAIIFDSENALEKMGGKLAAKRMEEHVNELLNKYGLVEDAMTLTFNNDSTFRQKYKKLNLSGTYSVADKEVILKYAGRFKQLVGETQIDGRDLVIVMDIHKLNEYIIDLARLSPDPKAQMLCKLLARIKDVKCGLRFEKQNGCR